MSKASVTEAGRPVAKIVPLLPRVVDRRIPGPACGRIVRSPDFGAPLPKELAKRFE